MKSKNFVQRGWKSSGFTSCAQILLTAPNGLFYKKGFEKKKINGIGGRIADANVTAWIFFSFPIFNYNLKMSSLRDIQKGGEKKVAPRECQGVVILN